MGNEDKRTIDVTGIENPQRRSFIKKAAASSVGLGTALSTAGCSGERQTNPPGESPTDTPEPETDTDTSESTETGPKRGGDLRIIIRNPMEGFDQRTTGWLGEPADDLHETLITRDFDNNYQPGLAKDWTWENDNQDLVFELREGVTFHDGSKFNAEYVKWFFMSYLMEGAGTAYIVDGKVDDVIVEDEYTARIKLKAPTPNLIWNLSSGWTIVHSREAVEEYGDQYGREISVGTGPFEWDTREGDSHIVLNRYDEYDWAPDWIGIDGSARAKSVTYDVITETASRTGTIETGETDILRTGVPRRKVENYKENEEITVDMAKGRAINGLGFNLDPEASGSPIFAKDVSLRKAISHAINRQDILSGIYFDVGEVANNLLPPVIPSHDIAKEHNHQYDIEKAKQLMRDNGWSVNPGGVSTKNGTKAEFELISPNNSTDKKRATVYKSQLEEIGVKANVTVIDNATFDSRTSKGNYDGMVYGWVWGNADILDWFFAFDMQPEPAVFRMQDEKANELIEDAMSAATWDSRVEKFKKAHAYLMAEVVPMAPEVYPQPASATRSHVKDWNFYLQGATTETTWSTNW